PSRARRCPTACARARTCPSGQSQRPAFARRREVCRRRPGSCQRAEKPGRARIAWGRERAPRAAPEVLPETQRNLAISLGTLFSNPAGAPSATRGDATFLQAPAHPRHQAAHAQQLVHERWKRFGAVLVAPSEVADDALLQIHLELIPLDHGFSRLR